MPAAFQPESLFFPGEFGQSHDHGDVALEEGDDASDALTGKGEVKDDGGGFHGNHVTFEVLSCLHQQVDLVAFGQFGEGDDLAERRLAFLLKRLLLGRFSRRSSRRW